MPEAVIGRIAFAAILAVSALLSGALVWVVGKWEADLLNAERSEPPK
jgi:uncharacterized membrane protein YiaA